MLATNDAEMMTEMNVWLNRQCEAVSAEGFSTADIEQRRARAWHLWQQTVLRDRDQLTLIEILEGPKPERWSDARVKAERSRFDVFWAEHVTRLAERQFAALQEGTD